MKNLLKMLSIPALALATMLQTNCPNINIKPILNITLPEGPYPYSIQVNNLYTPDEEICWINRGDTKITVELNLQSYNLSALGYDVGYYPGWLILLRYPSKEEYYISPKPGEVYNITFTMNDSRN